MKLLIQRVNYANVNIENELFSEIKNGLLIFIGISVDDSVEKIEYLCKKISNIRIFNDSNDKMFYNINEINGEILIVSQFTLLANTHKGNRPSFSNAAEPTFSNNLYELFIEKLQLLINTKIQTGKFGAMMKVNLENDGPFTLILER